MPACVHWYALLCFESCLWWLLADSLLGALHQGCLKCLYSYLSLYLINVGLCHGPTSDVGLPLAAALLETLPQKCQLVLQWYVSLCVM